MADQTQTAIACPACAGRGVLPNPAARQMQVCPLCNGAGIKQQQPFRVPFDYVLPNAVLIANQVGVVVSQQIDQDSDMEVIWIVSNQTGLYSVTLRDPSTGRDMSTAPVNGENFAGTAQLPFPLVEPYVWARTSTIKATFNDRSGAGNTIQLVLKGYKLYPRGAPMQGSQGAIVNA